MPILMLIKFSEVKKNMHGVSTNSERAMPSKQNQIDMCYQCIFHSTMWLCTFKY
jgi:hypothetical protein